MNVKNTLFVKLMQICTMTQMVVIIRAEYLNEEDSGGLYFNLERGINGVFRRKKLPG